MSKKYVFPKHWSATRGTLETLQTLGTLEMLLDTAGRGWLP